MLFAGGLAVGCGGGPDPILKNVPQPNTASMAGAAAAIAGAATLASPDSAAKKAESNKAPDEPRPVEVEESVPSDVFDRVEDKTEPKNFVDQAPEPPTPKQPRPKN